MIQRLALAILYGVIVAVVLGIVLSIIPGGALYLWAAPLIGLLVAVVVFFSRPRQPL